MVSTSAGPEWAIVDRCELCDERSDSEVCRDCWVSMAPLVADADMLRVWRDVLPGPEAAHE